MDISDWIFSFSVIGIMLVVIIESIAVYYFLPMFFRAGIKVKTTQGLNIQISQLEIGKIYETSHVRFKRINKNSCLFTHRFSFFQIRTPFPIKGEISLSESGTSLIWRIPLGSTLFWGLWLLVWCSSFFIDIYRLFLKQINFTDFAFTIFAVLFGLFWVSLIYALSEQTEEKRARLALSELLFFSLRQ